MSTHVIKYNKPRTYDVYKRTDSGARLNLHLNPGVNNIPTDLWRAFVSDDEELKGHPGTVRRIEDGEIEVLSILGAGKETAYYLAEHSVKEAIDTIDGVYGEATLEKWLSEEQALDRPRAGVVRKLESQLKLCQSAVNGDDSEEVAY